MWPPTLFAISQTMNQTIVIPQCSRLRIPLDLGAAHARGAQKNR